MRLPVTGIGVLAPGATGVAAFREQLALGISAIGEVDRFETAGLGATRAGLIRDFKPKDFIAPMKMRRMNTLSRYALAAARMAVDDDGQPLAETTGLAAGTAFGPVQTSVDYMQEYVAKGAALAPPQLFAESVANAPGSHIAIEYGLRGFNITLTQRESSALAALMFAAAQIAKGTADAAMVGGVDEVNEMLFTVLDRVGALASSKAGEPAVMRPFDANRNGLLIGEGSAFLVVRRDAGNAKVYGHISGFGIARDTTATISDWGNDSASVESAMRAAIEDAELTPGDIDAVYASANGSVRGDAVEGRALHLLFGDTLPPVVASKGVFGEYAAGGALQIVAALLALEAGTVHPSAGFEAVDPELSVTPQRIAQALPLRHVLVNSVSAGGGIVSAVLSREPS